MHPIIQQFFAQQMKVIAILFGMDAVFCEHLSLKIVEIAQTDFNTWSYD